MVWEKGGTPDWAALERLVGARFPKKPAPWAKQAVEQYVHFLMLKAEETDWDSEKFSPSGPIDEIWHAHLSFLDRYHHDVCCLSQGSHLIEHSPVLGDVARKRYAAAHAAHTSRMKRLGQAVVADFWPKPNPPGSVYTEEHDGDSDDANLSLPNDDFADGPACG